ncbi:TPA: calcium-binding protein [Streptococcus suis]|nr:calcium-binding protein [Streptococcus suis]
MEPNSIYTRDSDQDGLTDAQELALGTNPFSSDSDSDGLTDLEEVQRGFEPRQHQRKESSYDLEL